MNSVQVIEDVDDPAPLEEDENVQSMYIAKEYDLQFSDLHINIKAF